MNSFAGLFEQLSLPTIALFGCHVKFELDLRSD